MENVDRKPDVIYEYQWVRFLKTDSIEKLNALGADGWRLKEYKLAGEHDPKSMRSQEFFTGLMERSTWIEAPPKEESWQEVAASNSVRDYPEK